MKQIFTLLSAVLFAFGANAQIAENFENYASLTGNCWQLSSTRQITGNFVIGGSASIGTNPTETAVIATPYLDFTGTYTVTFSYLLNDKLNNNSERLIEVGTTDKNGQFVSAGSVRLDKTTASNKAFTFTKAFDLTNATRRLTIRISAIRGDGNTFVVIDNLSVTGAALHYGATPCNAAPVAQNSNLVATSTPFNGSLAGRAKDDNAGENLTFTLANYTGTTGTLKLNADGTLVFTPNGSFAGGPVSFTYYVTDNGYDPLRSNIATATINFTSEASILPVNLTSFNGNSNGNKAQLSWAVTQNEDGNYFQVEKSSDGKKFNTAAIVMNTGKSGAEAYNFSDAAFNGAAYYRIMVVNKSGAVSYSRVIMLKVAGDAKANALTLLQNPVTTTVSFSYNAAAAGTGIINLYTTAGVRVYTTQLNLRSGANASSFNLDSKLAPGSYVLEVVNGAERSVAKLVKY